MALSTTLNKTDIAPVSQPKVVRSAKQRGSSVAEFLAIAVQFSLIVAILNYWQLESPVLVRVMQVSFVGFVVHHILPSRFRLPFFAILSVITVITSVGHFGPNVLARWLGGQMSTSNLLYHLAP